MSQPYVQNTQPRFYHNKSLLYCALTVANCDTLCFREAWVSGVIVLGRLDRELRSLCITEEADGDTIAKHKPEESRRVLDQSALLVGTRRRQNFDFISFIFSSW